MRSPVKFTHYQITMLEKRIEAYSLLYGRLYSIATCLHRNDRSTLDAAIDQFSKTLLQTLFYLDQPTKEKVLPVYAYSKQYLDSGEFNQEKFVDMMNEANRQLFSGIKMKYM